MSTPIQIGKSLSYGSPQTLTQTEKDQLAENWPDAFSVAPAGPFADLAASGVGGVDIGDQWFNPQGQVAVRYYAINSEATAHYASFANTVSEQVKYRLSSCIDQLKAASLWDDLVEFVPFGTQYNAGTGTTRYALVGDDLTGVTIAPSGTRQLFAANQYFTLPTTLQDPRIEATMSIGGSRLQTTPSSGIFIELRNTSDPGDGQLFFWFNGGTLQVQTAGDTTQDNAAYSPTTTYSSLTNHVFSTSGSVSNNRSRFAVDAGTPQVIVPTHGVASRDFDYFRLSDDIAYSSLMVWDRELTDAELVTLNTILRDTIFTNPGSMILDGDSIIASTGGITPSYAARTVDDPDLDMTSLQNIATGGHTTVDILAGVTSGVTGAAADAVGAEKWYACNGGANDVARLVTGAAGDWTTAAIHGRMRDIAALAQAEGRLVAVITPILLADTNAASIYNSNLMELRDLLIADVGTYFDGVIDLHKSFLAVNANYQNDITIINDAGVHPYTETGQEAMSAAYTIFLQNRQS
tara:strand:- start:405 stop:1967 length:1563 start_codon:yes stop_codon:yes gene_type:complete